MKTARAFASIRARATVSVLLLVGRRSNSSKVSFAQGRARPSAGSSSSSQVFEAPQALSSVVQDQLKEQETFYQRYLRKRLGGVAEISGEWAYRLDVEACENAVPERLRERPLEAFKSYLRYLTYALAAEKADKYLWKWLTSPYVPEYARSWSRDERRQWKGRALRQFVESKVCWAVKPADQLHVGMETFTTAIALTADAREASYIPKDLAGRWLVQQYMSPGQRTVRVEDHEQMTELIRTYSFEPYEQWFERARMQMAHPTKPRADEAFAFFMASEETQAKSNFVRNMINPKDGKVASLLFFMVVKAAQQLDGAGRTVEARTLLDFGRRRMPA
ncbi:hypothetical protein LTR17_005942 [Elasticomyces elasticus]|nr:hypothetical protein LTR17_005942 [Elasticomyces elasticus]